jgi:hypothetical protein
LRFPFRDFAKAGVITDTDSYDSPLNAFSMASNVRFENGRISRGPIFARLGPLAASPRHILSYDDPITHVNHTILTAVDGKVYDWTETGGAVDLTPSTYTPSTSEAVTKSLQTSAMVYINREDHVPFYLQKNSTGHFIALDQYNSGDGLQQFQSTWRFKSLVSFGGTLFGIDVTEGSVLGPVKVKWSDLVVDNTAPPKNWDISATTSSAGENILDDAQGELIDALKVGSFLLIFSNRETYLCEFIGGNDMFSFRRLFDGGILNQNCAVELDGKAFVFGDINTSDLYCSDGTSKVSIATNAVKDYVYSTLVRSEVRRSFVILNQKLSEVMFCYCSNDPTSAFPYNEGQTTAGCNRAAVFNLNSKTWSFYDLAWCTAACFGNLSSGIDYADATMSFANIGGSFAALDTGSKDILLTVSTGYTSPTLHTTIAPAIRSLEPHGSTSVAGTIDTEATAPIVIRKDMIDLSEMKASLRDYKTISSIYVKGRTGSGAPIVFQVGTCDNPGDSPVFGNAQSFTPTNFKLDFNQSGRFHALRITYDDPSDFSLSGLDFEAFSLGAK